MIYLHKTAVLSDCFPIPLYRYLLFRRWKSEGPTVTFIMLNPSIADGTKDDPTINQCVELANRWGAAALMVVNLFAYRATEPKAMLKVEDPVGKSNLFYVSYAASHAVESGGAVICAWGANGSHKEQDKIVLQGLSDHNIPAFALRLTNKGLPWHPLYIPRDIQVIPYSMEIRNENKKNI